MLKIHVANQTEADKAWRMLQHADEDIRDVELHLDGHGLLWLLLRDSEGEWKALPSARQAHTVQRAADAAS
mgnify:CR=1 FL=1